MPLVARAGLSSDTSSCKASDSVSIYCLYHSLSGEKGKAMGTAAWCRLSLTKASERNHCDYERWLGNSRAERIDQCCDAGIEEGEV